jgi:hypothetical protein
VWSRIAACDACDSTVTASLFLALHAVQRAPSLLRSRSQTTNTQNLPFRGYTGWSLVNSSGNTTPPVMQSSPAVVFFLPLPKQYTVFFTATVWSLHACMNLRPKKRSSRVPDAAYYDFSRTCTSRSTHLSCSLYSTFI